MKVPRAVGRGFGRSAWSGALAALVLFNATLGAVAAPAVPVRVGGDGDLPACGERAVINDREAVDGRVEVSSGPARSFRPIDRLEPGAEVFLCDEKGTFLGVIYGEGDCGLEEPIERRASYRGTCDSGWLHNRSLDPSPAGPV